MPSPRINPGRNEPTLDTPPKFVIAFSGGIQSYVAAKRIITAHGPNNCILLFCDTSMEDPDCYRFLDDARNILQAPLITLRDGRNPWEIFRDEKMLGNWHTDPCSKLLKRTLAKTWVRTNCRPDTTSIVIGFDWTELHRHKKAREAWWPYSVILPLMYNPMLSKCDMLAIAHADGLRPQRLYSLGFAHSNCGGYCCKAGLAHYRHLLATLPEIYAYHEAQEEQHRRQVNADATFLTRQRNGVKQRLTMRQYREAIEAGEQETPEDLWGGCGCFA